MSQRDGTYSIGDMIQCFLNLHTIVMAFLKRYRREDQLEVVLDPMLHLTQQNPTTLRFGLNAHLFCRGNMRVIALQKCADQCACGHQKVGGILAEVSGYSTVDLQNRPSQGRD